MKTITTLIISGLLLTSAALAQLPTSGNLDDGASYVANPGNGGGITPWYTLLWVKIPNPITQTIKVTVTLPDGTTTSDTKPVFVQTTVSGCFTCAQDRGAWLFLVVDWSKIKSAKFEEQATVATHEVGQQ